MNIYTHFDETGHAEPWRNEVAKDLNTLLGRAQYFRQTSNDESDRDAERATLAIVERVATFEKIQSIPTPAEIELARLHEAAPDLLDNLAKLADAYETLLADYNSEREENGWGKQDINEESDYVAARALIQQTKGAQ